MTDFNDGGPVTQAFIAFTETLPREARWSAARDELELAIWRLEYRVSSAVDEIERVAAELRRGSEPPRQRKIGDAA